MADETPEPAGTDTTTTAGQAGEATGGAAKAAGAVPRARTPAKPATPGRTAKAKTAEPSKSTKSAKTAKAAARTARQPAKQTAKKAPKKASKAPDAQPAQPPAEPLTQAAATSTGLTQWAEAAWEAVREPEDGTRRLAELAVAEFGPRAAAWAAWLRATYPGVPSDALARLAAQQARQAGTLVTGAGLTGPLAPLLHPVTAGAARVLVVLRVAAAYGHDPTDLARATDLRDLLDLDIPDEAGLAGRLVGQLLRVGRLRGLRRRFGPVRAALALLELSDERDRLERLAHRATRHYRSRSSSPARAASSSERNSP